MVVAIYDYVSEVEGDLNFKEGDEMEVLEA